VCSYSIKQTVELTVNKMRVSSVIGQKAKYLVVNTKPACANQLLKVSQELYTLVLFINIRSIILRVYLSRCCYNVCYFGVEVQQYPATTVFPSVLLRHALVCEVLKAMI
jgi:hypothetical protein